MLRPPCRAILLSLDPQHALPALEAAGCEVTVAGDENQAADLKAEVRPEVIFLHNPQPGISGKLRRLPPQLQAVHCLLVDADNLEQTDVAAGYDDFMSLPLNPAEVASRVRLWRWRREQISSEGIIKAGPLAVDMANLSVTVDGTPVTLTFKEYELLCLLLRRRGQALTRQHILDAIWGPDYYGGERTVDVHIRRLRTKIPELTDMISTVHGIGYRFEA
ncbi:MAG TPA: response regulator transcription factor [Tepidisphaeraceae bacterium]|nr:response regulator transcription factor [Tepidisphaeraceae bacterium]